MNVSMCFFPVAPGDHPAHSCTASDDYVQKTNIKVILTTNVDRQNHYIVLGLSLNSQDLLDPPMSFSHIIIRTQICQDFL